MDADEKLVRITDKAASTLQGIMARESQPGIGLRLALVRTHCMGGRGFVNTLAFEDTTRTDDEVLEHNGIKLWINPSSAKYLKGAELDYIETSMEAGFKVNNPNVIAKCPCGHHDIFE